MKAFDALDKLDRAILRLATHEILHEDLPVKIAITEANKLNIPVIWYHTDGHPDYHMPGDHSDKINWSKVVDITKASFLNMWNLANEKKF